MTQQERLESVGYKFRSEINRWGTLQPTGRFLHHYPTLPEAINGVTREIERIREILNSDRAALVFEKEGTAYWENIIRKYDGSLNSFLS